MSQKTHGAVSVLIIDDDDFLRAQLESWLRNNSRFECVGSCADGESGLEEICSKKPSLAIVDLALPNMNGIEVIWRAKEQTPSVKIIAVTRNSEDRAIIEALEAGRGLPGETA